MIITDEFVPESYDCPKLGELVDLEKIYMLGKLARGGRRKEVRKGKPDFACSYWEKCGVFIRKGNTFS